MCANVVAVMKGSRGEAQKPGGHLDALKHHLVGETHRLTLCAHLEAG